MSEELKKEIENLIYKYFKVYNITTIETCEDDEPPDEFTLVGELLALVEQERHKSYSGGYADAYNPHCTCKKNE